jgi:hypothetical protein
MSGGTAVAPASETSATRLLMKAGELEPFVDPESVR